MKWEFLILATFIITFLPLVSSVNLDTGTILNTSVSNSSMTFSVPITVDNFTVDSTSITLNTIICSNGANLISQIVWAVPNANNDSAVYCYNVPPVSCNSSLRGTLGIISFFSSFLIFIIVLTVIYKKGIITNPNTLIIIIAFIGLSLGIAFLTEISNSIFGICAIS